jgi:CDP-diacylglycerol--glycerol-3-phosphate 3-phosphatidyltransferase
MPWYKISTLDTNYEKAEKVTWHDRLLDRTVLRMFPKNILPNHVTAFRFAATPIVALLMFFEQYQIGLIAFLIVAFSDAIDGAMARTRNQVTEWGKIYDPLADKILIGSMVFIIVLRYIDIFASAIIVFLEVVFIFLAWRRLKKGGHVQANIWGKIKMILQVSGVIFLLLSIVFNLADLLPLVSGTFYLAIAFAVMSLVTHSL